MASLIEIDRMKSTTEVKEALGKIATEHDAQETDNDIN
jgi:hypothetical protein